MSPHPSGGIGRHKGLENLSPRGETPEVTPVKVGEGPDRIPPCGRVDTEPSPPDNEVREGVESRRRAPKAVASQGEGVLQTTNGPKDRRRKPKWYENPSVERSCRFESGLGYQRYF